MVPARAISEKKTSTVRGRKRGTAKRSRKGRRTAGGARQAPPTPKRQKPGGGADALGAALKKDDGCAAVLVVGEQTGGLRDDATASCRIPAEPRGAHRSKCTVGGKKGRVGGLTAARVCRAFAVLGHEQRARMLGKLLEGPATYRLLQRLTKLKAGPLYHHINQMRMAGLILPKQRDLYELTRGGRNLILAAIVAVPLIGDARRRPQPAG